MSIAKSNLARRRAEARRCPKCHRKSALTTEMAFDDVVTYCRWNDCDYESVTFAHDRP